MRFGFFTNFLNHHQLPLAKAFVNRLGNDYTMVVTEKLPEERRAMGYHDMSEGYPFVLSACGAEGQIQARKLIQECDVVIAGSVTDDFILDRLKKGAVTFRYSERYFKKGLTVRTFPRAFLSALKHIRRFQNMPLYYLCASAYTAADVNRFADFSGKTYKWGYFPETISYDVNELFEKKDRKKSVTLLWVGRLIEWKHPEAAIETAARLKADGYNFVLRIIGNGAMERQLHEMIEAHGLKDCVEMPGAMRPEDVRRHMEAADIFLMTSDFREGWGAVLNEAMNSACAVAISHAVGAAPYLVKNGENGLIYKNGDLCSLYESIRRLMDSPALRRSLGEKAYETIVNTWNAEVAAERFLTFADEILRTGQCDLFQDGPCSRAEILKNGWMK